MVGGKVIEVAEVKDRPGVLFVDVRDKFDTCAVYVERSPVSDQIQIGDSLWWQCGKAYWTPQAVGSTSGRKCGVEFDIPLVKVGYSGCEHPLRKQHG